MAKIDDSVKKKVPELRFKGFTDDWEQRKLGDEVRIVMGQSPNSENYTDDPNDYILVQGNADMKNGRVLPRVWTTQVTKQAEKDDLILSVRAPVGDIGKTAYDVVIGRGVAAIKGNEFIFQNLGKMKSDGYWTRYSTGSTFESINSTDIKEAIISVPAIEEQDKIGSFFQQLDETIALHQRELDNLKITKQVFMKKMFPKEGEKVPEVRFPGFMADWDYRKLGDVGETYTGLSGKSKDDFGHGRGKYVTYMNVFSNSIANPSLVELVEIDTKQNEVNPGDIFFTTSSETPAEVGMSSVWLENSDNTYLNSFCFGYRPIEKFDNYYLAYMLRSSVVRKKITFLAQGISRYNISKNKVMDIAVPIPVIEEQTKIGEFFKQLDDIINLQQQELEKLKQTKQAFLQKMFI